MKTWNENFESELSIRDKEIEKLMKTIWELELEIERLKNEKSKIEQEYEGVDRTMISLNEKIISLKKTRKEMLAGMRLLK